jgi:hypothetical protein
MNDITEPSLKLEMYGVNTIYSRLQEVYFQSAANLIINSFEFPRIFPKKIIHFLYKRDFIKHKYDKNYVDICAIKNNEVIGIMRAKYSKNNWTINTNCVDKKHTQDKPFLWIKIMLFLANEILKDSKETTVSFPINNISIKINTHYYRIAKVLNNV